MRLTLNTAQRRAGKARAITVPSTRIAGLYANADLLDAFAIEVCGENARLDVETLARAAFEHPARWIRALMAVRDAAMKILGVKTTLQISAEAAAKGPVIGFFPLLSRSECELIIGVDDRHLNFRAALQLRVGSSGGKELVAVTVVHCHSLLGRIYLTLIAPFHRAIVKANLERAGHYLR